MIINVPTAFVGSLLEKEIFSLFFQSISSVANHFTIYASQIISFNRKYFLFERYCLLTYGPNDSTVASASFIESTPGVMNYKRKITNL